jgi:signal transduction histidine kinase
MKLLDKTVRILLLYAIVVLLVSIPAFYLVIVKLDYKDVKDALLLKKEILIENTKRLSGEHDIKVWLEMDREVSMHVYNGTLPIKDSIYQKRYLNTLEKEVEPYLELKTTLNIQGKTYLTTIRRSLVEKKELIIEIVKTQAVLLILLFGGWIIINRNISRKIWKPFDEIIAWLKKYEMGKDPYSGITSSGIAEFDVLNKVVNDLIYKNHDTFIQQKNFIENASHEMQTPVAILQSKLDLLIGSQGLTAEQARYLQSLYEAIERLNHLNKSLLLLSQIENNQFDDLSAIALPAVIAKVIEHLEEVIDEKGLQLKLDIMADKIIRGNPMLMEICLSNLITNAVNHTPANGYINIVLDDQRLVIENSGEPLSFEPQLLFTRFGKSKTSKFGVGLGLAIVKQIADFMPIGINYQYANKHCFTLKF